MTTTKYYLPSPVDEPKPLLSPDTQRLVADIAFVFSRLGEMLMSIIAMCCFVANIYITDDARATRVLALGVLCAVMACYESMWQRRQSSAD